MCYTHTVDSVHLIARDAYAFADDLANIEQDGCIKMLRAELDAVEALILARSFKLAPTPARSMAIELIPAVAMLCRNENEIDDILLQVRDWIVGLGDLRQRARHVVNARRFTAQLTANAALKINDQAAILDVEVARDDLDHLEDATTLAIQIAFNAMVVFRIHDERTLVALLQVHRRAGMIVGTCDLGNDDGTRVPVVTPMLAA